MRRVIEFKLILQDFCIFFLYLTYNFMYDLNSCYILLHVVYSHIHICFLISLRAFYNWFFYIQITNH